MGALLSMKQFVLLASYGGVDSSVEHSSSSTKHIVHTRASFRLMGLYGREMNTALIQVLQSLEGFSPSEATDNFGNGTKLA